MEVVGRDRERATLEAVLGAPDGLPRVALVEGEPGLGKTTLWRWAVDAARARGYIVLAASPAAAEAQASFIGIADLLDGVIDGQLPLLAPARRRALGAALRLDDPADRMPEAPAVGMALLAVLRRLVGERPVLLAVDDVQWLDPDSLAAMRLAIRRLVDAPLRVLFTVRPAARDGGPFSLAALGLDAVPGDRIERITLGPLSLEALHQLVIQRTGQVLSRPALRHLNELANGNPFYVLELMSAYRRGSIRLDPGEPLPADLDAFVTARIAALPRATRVCLAAAAMLSRPTLDVLGRALGQAAEIDEVLLPAIREGLVTVDEAVHFRHPLLAAAAHGILSAPRRREIHRRLAAATDDLEERARQMAAGTKPPDAAIAEALESAAVAAARRGATSVAAQLAAQGVRFTPETDAAAGRRRRLLEAEYRFESGEAEVALGVLESLVAGEPPGPERARLLSRQARFRHFAEDVGIGVEILRQALAEAGDDPALRSEIEEGLAWGLLLLRQDLPAAAEHASSAVRHARRLGDQAALAEALAAEGLTHLACGRQAERSLQQAMALEPATLHLRVLRHPTFAFAYWLACTDEVGRARASFRALERRAIESGDDSALPPIHNHLAMIECLAGNLDEAAARADEAHMLALQEGQRPSLAASLGRRALVWARRGVVEQARSDAQRSLQTVGDQHLDVSHPSAALARGGEVALWTLGSLALSLGDPVDADRHLRPLTGALLAAGVREPGELRCVPDAIEALVLLGNLEAARALLDEYQAIADASRRPSALAAAAHCHGRLLAAGGDLAGAQQALEGALGHHDASPLRLEKARTLLVLGEVLRRRKQKRRARERLDQAISEFEALGADIWSARARAELARISGRVRAQDLTPTERRTAELVAQGRSNREVAAALFVTPKTVETTLTRVYAKLGVRSRTALARRLLARGTDASANTPER